MGHDRVADAAKAVVRRNTEEVQSRGNFEVFDEVFADDFVDHTPQPNMTPVAPTGRTIHFETVDVMRVHNGKITEYWGVANLFSLMQQLGAFDSKNP
jgi:predicted SnoaL-like aldol condensation-catalyzing enzyme